MQKTLPSINKPYPSGAREEGLLFQPNTQFVSAKNFIISILFLPLVAVLYLEGLTIYSYPWVVLTAIICNILERYTKISNFIITTEVRENRKRNGELSSYMNTYTMKCFSRKTI